MAEPIVPLADCRITWSLALDLALVWLARGLPRDPHGHRCLSRLVLEIDQRWPGRADEFICRLSQRKAGVELP